MCRHQRARAIGSTTLRCAFVAVAATACGPKSASSPGQGPSYAPSCRIDVLQSHPGTGYVEVGQLSFEAFAAGPMHRVYKSPYELARDIRADICSVGGDTLMTERNAAGVIVHATVFRRVHELDLPPPPADPRTEPCEPSCSAGARCEGGTCVAP